MKMTIYAILIAAAFLIPTRPLELGKLKPVEVIKIEKQGERILIETDTADTGIGKTVKQAIWNLHETAAGTVYLDTAEYILLPPDETLPDDISPYLRENVRACRWEGKMKLEEAAEYLDAHRPRMKLKDYQTGVPLQTLVWKNGRFHLQEKNIERREKTS